MDRLVYVQSLLEILQTTCPIVHEVSQFQACLVFGLLRVEGQLQVLECHLLVDVKLDLAVVRQFLMVRQTLEERGLTLSEQFKLALGRLHIEDTSGQLTE